MSSDNPDYHSNAGMQANVSPSLSLHPIHPNERMPAGGAHLGEQTCTARHSHPPFRKFFDE